MRLSEFHFKAIYVPGKQNVVANGLSRLLAPLGRISEHVDPLLLDFVLIAIEGELDTDVELPSTFETEAAKLEKYRRWLNDL